MKEQRKFPRIPIRLEVRWNGTTSRSPDVTSDLSLGGCYIESLNSVSKGDVLNLELCLPSNETIQFLGEVCYHQPNIGFGIKFLQLSNCEWQMLRSLIAECESNAVPAFGCSGPSADLMARGNRQVVV